MALTELKLAGNVDGDFFVDSTCIDCDLCRQIASGTFTSAGDQSIVYHQPETPVQEFAALKALVTCPTASIGTLSHHSAKAAVGAYPESIDDNVYFCGFASESSFGASSYLIAREEGNVLIDSPRFAIPLVKRIEKMGGVRLMFLTHRDDVADHEKWAGHFNAERVMHRDDATRSTAGIERVLTGTKAVKLDIDLLAIPTPGHTRGHTVLLYRNRYLFSGDHLWWSEAYDSLNASRSVCWYSWTEQTRSMERLLGYDFEWVLPGHGRRIHLDAPHMQEQLRQCVSRMKRS
ncbi:MAG TPA: MBL fold metallo-hydrolase [Blastocatellia bacterium]|jgi:glyoxylase-like metal-dependent hydrolase (beta-lactamase superfamily II)/ferredoxin